MDDETLGRIATKRKHLDLLERSRALKDKLLELNRHRDEITQTLAKIDAKLAYNNLNLQSHKLFRESINEGRVNFVISWHFF